MNKNQFNDDNDPQNHPTQPFYLESTASSLSSITRSLADARYRSTTVPSNFQDSYAILPAGSSVPSFTMQMNAAAATSNYELYEPPRAPPPTPWPAVHQDMIPSHEAFHDQLEYLIPSISDVDWDAIEAMEEYLQGTRTGHPEWDYFQPCAEQVQYDQFDLTAHSNSFIEGPSQQGMSLGGNQVFNDQGASMNQFGGFTPASSMLGTSIHPAYDFGRTLADQSLCMAGPSVPPVTQRPVRNRMFQGARKVDISGNARLMNIGRDNVTNMVNYDGNHGLEKMERFVSFSAQFDSSAQDPKRVCHPGTRQNVLRRVEDWIDDPNSTERIFWLHGPAGAGKSAIAQTIAKSCGRQKVVATFFFFRSDSSRNDGNMLFPTLAYQLAFSIPAMKDHIARSLHARPDLPTKGVEIQFDELIALPFRSLFGVTSQQSSPDNSIAAFNGCQQISPVIIIDGVDECTDEKLQERFLKIIGDAVKGRSIPFRFLICSRPEALIEDALSRFEPLIRSIDLAELDDANHDIEKFLIDEFSRIASKRHLRPLWPGQAVIEDIIYKSSGNFIFASVVIKVIGDEDNVPEDQLDIILNLKPPERMSPFAVLDELYLEILSRQLYQDFLKTFLALFIGRIEILYYYRNSGIIEDPCDTELYKDDAKLMGVSEEALHTKLRKMRSLLKFEPHIDVHHRSFLDFLNDPSRSGDYYVGKNIGTKQYLKLMVQTIVRYVSSVIENPDYHEAHHLDFEFGEIIRDYPLAIDLTIEELQDMSRPLLQVQDQILKQLDSRVATDLLFCGKCTISTFVHPLLLHLAIYRCIDAANEVKELVTQGKDIEIHPEAMQSVLENDQDNILSSLLTHLHETESGLSPSTEIIKYTYSILHFDCAEIASKVRSMSDAQRLVDFLVDLIDEGHILNQYEHDGMSKAVQLVLKIFVRIPVLPRLLLVRVERIADIGGCMVSVEAASLAILAWRILDHNYIHLEPYLDGDSLFIPRGSHDEIWEDVLPLDSCTVIALMPEIARACQYLYSMGITPGYMFDKSQVYFDLSVQPRIKISSQYLELINPFMRSTGNEDHIFGFGCLFYEIYFNKYVSGITIEGIAQRPPSPPIPECAWQLIQHCCAEDPKDRPTIDEVVEEMEKWKI